MTIFGLPICNRSQKDRSAVARFGGRRMRREVPPAQSRTMSEMGRVVAAMPDSVPG